MGAFSYNVDLVSLGTVALAAILYLVDTRVLARSSRDEMVAFIKTNRASIDNMSAKLDALMAELHEHTAADAAEFELVRREMGETIHAVRAHMQARADEILATVHREEIRTRDEYIRRDSFKDAIDGLQNSMSAQNTEIKAWLQRLENKIEAPRVGITK